MCKKTDDLIKNLQTSNESFASKNKEGLVKHVKGQSPKVAVLTCADSRVVPEFIFNKSIGELFVVRVAGNVAMDPSVIASLEYAVDHLNVDILLILGHTNCGAVAAAESDAPGILMDEIRESFGSDDNNIKANLQRQLKLLPKRSIVISTAVGEKKLNLIGAIYDLETGLVKFL